MGASVGVGYGAKPGRMPPACSVMPRPAHTQRTRGAGVTEAESGAHCLICGRLERPGEAQVSRVAVRESAGWGQRLAGIAARALMTGSHLAPVLWGFSHAQFLFAMKISMEPDA